MNAYVVVAFVSLDASVTMDQAIVAGVEPVAYAGNIGAVLMALLLVVVMLGTIDQLIRRHRRLRVGGHGAGAFASPRRRREAAP